MRLKFSTIIKSSITVLSLTTLTACWQSERSLIEPQNSATPLQSGVYEYYSGSTSEYPHDVQLIAFPGGGYVYYNRDEDTALPLLIHRIDEGWHILQLGNDAGTLIALSRRVGDRIEIYDPDCEDYLDGIEGLEIDLRDCSFENLEALVAASKRAAQRIEAGEQTEIHGWFKPDDVKPID